MAKSSRWHRRTVLFFAALISACAGASSTRAQAANRQEPFIEFVEAARMGDVATVRRLLAAGMDVNRCDGAFFPAPALYHALDARQLAVARVLIEAGADLKKMAGDGDYPLAWAAQAGDGGIVDLMIQKGTNPNERWDNQQTGFHNAHGNLPMEEALEWGRVDTVKALEKAGVSWLGGDRGAAALQLAAKSRNGECSAYLLDHGADVNAPCEGNQALDTAAARGDVAMMKLFLARGAKVNAVSDGESPINEWGPYQRTALVAAVINSQLEAVQLLLQTGADPKALDNLAIKWADLLGDYEAYDLLRKAGAPDPGAFAYRGWLHLNPVNGLPLLDEVQGKKTVLPPQLFASSQQAAGDTAGAALEKATKFAIINLGPDLDNAENLLAAKLSAVDKAAVLERSQIREILKERTLDQNFGGSPADNVRLGRLLGADALVILRAYPVEGNKVIEARIVSVSTGLVAVTVPFVADNGGLDEWSTQLANRCAVAGAWVFTPPEKAKLVAVTPFTASVNTPEARVLEGQLASLVALRLSQVPGVFLVERAMLDRLQAEGRTDDKVLLASSWLISGAVDPSLNDGNAVLRLTLTPGGGGAKREVRAAGMAAAPAEFAAEAVAQVAAVLDTQTDQAWAPAAEAAAFLQQGQAFVARKMWTEAENSAEAAWALGLRDDRVARLRMMAAMNRMEFSARYYSGAKRQRHDLYGVPDLMSYRVPLLLPPEDARELAVDDYIEQANFVLDALEPVLARTKDKMSDADYGSWVCSQVWDAATLALKVTEALSYQREYGDELNTLRTRVLTLNTQALQIARDRGDAKTIHTLIAARCKNLPWWVHGDADFQAEVRRLLHEAEGWEPPLSEHAVWGPVFEIAKDNMHVTSGRASQSWVRLAAVMAQSQDVRERYFGRALMALEIHNKAPMEKSVQMLMGDFPALVELDQSIPARVWAIGYKSGVNPGEGGPFECWYARAFDAVLNSGVRRPLTDGGHAPMMWAPTASGPHRILPELRPLYVTQCLRRLELIVQRGPSGYFLTFTNKDYFTEDEFKKLGELAVQAKAKFDALLKSYPQSARERDFGGLDPFARSYQKTHPLGLGPTSGESGDVRLVLKAPRVLFADGLARLSNEERKHVIDLANLKSFITPAGLFFTTSDGASDRSVVFSFAPDGAFLEHIVTPPRDKAGSRLVLNPWGLDEVNRSGADMTDDYFATAGFVGDNDDRGPTILLLYDRVAKKWGKIKPSVPCDSIFDVKFFGGKIYYTFLYNPTRTSLSGRDSEDAAQSGDLLRGVMEYDPKTAHFNLLGSNRRTPALSPLDKPGKEYGFFLKISDDEFAVNGFNTDVYNARTGKWRLAAKQDVPRWTDFKGPPSYCVVNGITWVPRSDKGGFVVFSNAGKSAQKLRFPLELQDGGVAEQLKPYPLVLQSYTRRGESGARFTATPDGWAVWVGPVYYWLPMAQAKAIIAKALAGEKN